MQALQSRNLRDKNKETRNFTKNVKKNTCNIFARPQHPFLKLQDQSHSLQEAVLLDRTDIQKVLDQAI